MWRIGVFLLIMLLGLRPGFAQQPERPKLVVGIVVDQMRYDFLYRYWSKYGDGGFKRLLNEGYNFSYTHYNYVPTYTGPGHASIYTGAFPAIHGIIGNDWYVRNTTGNTYCTQDNGVSCVGADSDAGKMSPRNLLTTTVTDELRLATNMGSRVFGVCLKDRGSILPAGHTANAAFWFDGGSGRWITSSFYMKEMPKWVTQYNKKNTADTFLNQDWETLLPINQYTESTADNNIFEGLFAGEKAPVFPHKLKKLRGNSYDLIKATPFGNTITKDFAIKTIEQEKLGKGEFTDFLALSFSSTDYVGHQFGPNSIEIEDTYLRLDRDIAAFLAFLDKYIGKENVLVFLTADHGAAHVPAYMQQQRIPAGLLAPRMLRDSVNQFMSRRYGDGSWILNFINHQVYLNRDLIAQRKLKLQDVQEEVAEYLMRFEGVDRTITAYNLQHTDWASAPYELVQNGFHPQRSGDVVVLLQPAWFERYSTATGTTHGSSSNYDTHVPLIFYGWQVKQGESAHPAAITDIAPTIANWLRIQEPNGCVGKPLQPYMK